MFLVGTASAMSVVCDASAQTSTLADIRTSGVIHIANTQTSPPWSSIDTKNGPIGYDVDVANEVARRMGIPKVIRSARAGVRNSGFRVP
jgi:cystine transport system substrate-binding protein